VNFLYLLKSYPLRNSVLLKNVLRKERKFTNLMKL